MTPGSPRAAAVLMAILAIAVPSRAATVLNGQFDDASSYLEGWLNIGSGETWSADDAYGSPDSGSVQITNTLAAGFSEYPYICVLANAGTHYLFGAQLKTLGNQTATGVADVIVGWESDFLCLNDIEYSEPVTSSAVDTWTPLQGEAVAPPNTVAARILLRVKKLTGDASDPFVVRFDDVTLPEPESSVQSLAALAALRLFQLRRNDAR